MPTRTPRTRGHQSFVVTASHVERCEERRLLASISGFVWNDADASKSFDAATESRLAGWDVYIDANKNGRFDTGEPKTTTDSRGGYRFNNLPAGEVVIGQTLKPGFGQTFPGREGARGSNFNIEFVFPDDSLTSAQKEVFELAAQRWEQLIIGDLPDFNSIAAGRPVDDLVIEARLQNIDGPGGILGSATYTERRPDSRGGLPTYGEMQFDGADYPPSIANSDEFKFTVLHEIAHVLGFGTLWEELNLLTGASGTTPAFVGAEAVSQYNRIFGVSATGVPVEAGGGSGTRNAHWSEDVFGSELMTGFSSPGFNPISSVTVGQFADLGYVVNLGLADPFSPTLAGAGPASNPRPNGYFVNMPPRKVGVLKPSAVTNISGPGLVAFSHTINLEAGVDRAGVNFGVIRNQSPRIANVSLSPNFQTIGQGIRVRANGLSTFNPPSAVNQNTIAEVRFYRESNGQAGLQVGTGAGFDTLIGTDSNGEVGGWAVTARTTNLSPGVVNFYAVAFDRYNFSAQAVGTGRLVVGPQTVPAEPSGVVARGMTANALSVSFLDNSDDEVGHLVEVSTDTRFGRSVTSREIIATDAQAKGTGLRITTVSGLRVGTEYNVRVRSFNTAGSSEYVRTSAITLSPGEVILDNNDPGVRRVGNWSADDMGTGFLGRDYLVFDVDPAGELPPARNVKPDPVPSVRYEPTLVNRRSYFVFARRLPAIDLAEVPEFDGIVNVPVTFQVRRGNQLVRQVTVTRNSPTLPGGWVLLGRFENRADRPINVRALGNAPFVVADAVRFLPAGPASRMANGPARRAPLPVDSRLFSTQPIPLAISTSDPAHAEEGQLLG